MSSTPPFRQARRADRGVSGPHSGAHASARRAGLSDSIPRSGLSTATTSSTIRISSFEIGGETAYFLGRADLMARNLDGRVEVLGPVEQARLRQELPAIFDSAFSDTASSWELSPGEPGRVAGVEGRAARGRQVRPAAAGAPRLGSPAAPGARQDSEAPPAGLTGVLASDRGDAGAGDRGAGRTRPAARRGGRRNGQRPHAP